MAIDALSYVLPALLVLWNAFLLAIPAFVLAKIGGWLASRTGGETGGKAGKGGKPKRKASFARSAFIATYAIAFAVLLVAYAFPFAAAWQAIDYSSVPEQVKPTNEEWSVFLGIQAIKVVLLALVFSLILLPFEFVGLWIHERLSVERRLNPHLSAFIACFAMCLVALAIILALPWVLPGLVYLVYFA